MVPPASHKVSRVSWYSGYCRRPSDFVYRTFTFFGVLFQNTSTILRTNLCSPQPQITRNLVWALSLSLATTQEIDVSFSSCRYLDVSVPCVPPVWLWIHHTVTWVRQVGFPHSDISGSTAVCASPELFAAYRVLLRLLVPRHPPYALISLT